MLFELFDLIKLCLGVSWFNLIDEISQFALDRDSLRAKDRSQIFLVDPEAVLEVFDGSLSVNCGTLFQNNDLSLESVLNAATRELPSANCIAAAVRVATAAGVARSRRKIAAAAAKLSIRRHHVVA